jgi:hypothetical protein
MNAQTTTATAERIAQATETRKTGTAEVCFGAIMAIAAVAGMWGAVSFLINQFMG